MCVCVCVCVCVYVCVSIGTVVGHLWGRGQNLSPSHPVKTIDLLTWGLEVAVPMASEGQLSLGVVLTQVFQGFFLEEPHVEQRAGRSRNSLSLLKQMYLFLWLHWIFVAARAFSSRDVRASHCGDFSCCRAPSLGAWTSVGAPWHVESWALNPWNQTHVPCTGRRALNH